MRANITVLSEDGQLYITARDAATGRIIIGEECPNILEDIRIRAYKVQLRAMGYTVAARIAGRGQGARNIADRAKQRAAEEHAAKASERIARYSGHWAKTCDVKAGAAGTSARLIGFWQDLVGYYVSDAGTVWSVTQQGRCWTNEGSEAYFREHFAAGRYRGDLLPQEGGAA